MEAIRVERVEDAGYALGGQVIGEWAHRVPFLVPGIRVWFGDTVVTMDREDACNLGAALTEVARDG